jgi:hypothetical protein
MYNQLICACVDGVKKMKVRYADYEEKGKFFGNLNSPISLENFERYKEKYGEERALGYLEAIRDFTHEFGLMQNTIPNERHTYHHTDIAHRIGPAPSHIALTDFRKHNLKFLENFDTPDNSSIDNKNTFTPVI